jgi:hypothetical protein
MTHFERQLRKTEEMSDAHSDYYDCAACLWPGVMVEKGDEEQARREFDAHECKDYPPLQK